MFKGFNAAGVAFGIVALVAAVQPAQASIYNNTFSVVAFEGLSNGNGFDTANGNPYTGSNTASASFVYTGALNFSNTAPQNSTTGDTNASFGFSTSNISGYSGSGTVTYNSAVVADFSGLSAFLGSSASASDYKFGTYLQFDLGTVVAGTVLTITHDDGVALFQNGARIGNTTSGPTGAVTETVRVDSTGVVALAYSHQNGSPSILQVAVPEPMSLGLLGVGLAGLGMVRRRKRAA